MKSIARSTTLSARSLLTKVRGVFQSIPDHRQLAKCIISLPDALMSGLAVFSLKFPSLLKFDEQRNEQHIRHNLNHLYGVTCAASDTQLREVLDPVVPAALHPAFRIILKETEDTGALESYRFLDSKKGPSKKGPKKGPGSIKSGPKRGQAQLNPALPLPGFHCAWHFIPVARLLSPKGARLNYETEVEKQ